MMAYHLKLSSFLCSLGTMNFVFVLLANGQSTIKESGNGDLENILVNMHQRVIDEIRRLNNEIKSLERKLTSQDIQLKDIHKAVFVRRRDCADVKKSGFDTNGIYEIMLPDERLVSVYCDMESSGIGWLVFQRRMDGSVDFFREWDDYTNGFGNKSGEFWLGNDLLHLLTSRRKYKLRIDLEDFEGNKTYAEYENFSIGSAADKYRLTVENYTGNAGDSLGQDTLWAPKQNGMQFSTRDNDNDIDNARNCAYNFRGAWWYSNCHNSNLNGLYLRGWYKSDADGVFWGSFRGGLYSLKITQMKISPADICS